MKERLHARDGRRTGTGGGGDERESGCSLSGSAEGYAGSSLCADSSFGDQLGMM